MPAIKLTAHPSRPTLGALILSGFRILLTLVLLSALRSPVLAEAESRLAPVNRSSPSETYQSLFSGAKRLEDLYVAYTEDKSFANLQEIRYHLNRLRGLLDLSDIPPANRIKIGNAAITYLSDILVRLPPLDPASIPGGSKEDRPLPARWTIPGTDIQIARVEDGEHAGEYLFTAESISNLHEYYMRIKDEPVLYARRFPWLHREHIRSTGPLIPGFVTRNIPAALDGIYLNTPTWKILAIAIVTLLALSAAYLWTRIVRHRTGRGSEVRKLAWRLTMPITFLLLSFLSVWFVIAHINPSGQFAAWENLISTTIFYGLLAWSAWLASFLVVEILISTPRIAGNSLDAHLLRLAARIVAVTSAGGILVYGANEVGIPALGLVAGVGIGGIALALASQATIENLFGGLSLFADRPFRIGDVIRFGSERGTVEMVGTRSSRIRALDGTLMTIPNGDLAKMHIVNFTRRNKCLFLHTIALRVDTPADRLRLLLQDLRTLIASDEMVEKSKDWPRIRCVGVGIGRIDVELRAYVLTSDYNAFPGIQEHLLLQIFERIDQMGIQLAPPVVVTASQTSQ